ncbi:cytosolic protein [Bacillus lacus]|uniref:Cytosolic protein n=1 Tax=Metabacillus lacus TaxID=1983721 RepID=A0A7X2LWP4_9BACI|nr:YlbD family protein [Metabacillus lacus]MRX71705.1 cytosolic protein [Metabacillus lacus]
MSVNNLHPSVESFKDFVKKHPKMIQEVRKGQKTWQEFYEEWYLLGENDVTWKKYGDVEVQQENDSAESKQSFVSQMLQAVKTMDANAMNQNINKVSNTISTIQGLMEQLGLSKAAGPQNSNAPNSPFSFRKD